MRLAAPAFVLGACFAPAEVEGLYEVSVEELFDDCAISEGPYPAFVMAVSQQEDWVLFSLPAGGPYRDHFFEPIASAHDFLAFVEGSAVTGALSGSFRTLGEECGFYFRLDFAAEVDDGALSGRLTVSDTSVFPPGCAPQPNCQTQQAFAATRLP